MILDDQQLVAGGARRRQQAGAVDRLHRVEIDDPNADAAAGQLVVGGERLVQRDAGGHDRQRVALGRAHDLEAADREGLVRPVDGRCFIRVVRR